MKHRYSKDQLQEAINQSTSIRQVLIQLGISPQGGNYRIVHNAIKTWGFDVSHFTGQAHALGKTIGPKVPVTDYLVIGSKIGSNRLRKRLLKEGIFTHVCSVCKNVTWNELPIPLELDHVDGNHTNNELSNLRLLCPNCHAQTHTYRGKNKGRYQI